MPLPTPLRRRSGSTQPLRQGPRPWAGVRVFELTSGEQLLLWSARRWRHGRFGWPQVETEFRRAVGPSWPDALIAWEQVLDLLHALPVGAPDIRNGCDTDLSADERALLSAVAVVQAGTPVAPDLLLRRLACGGLRQDLARWIEELATALGTLRLVPAAPGACGDLSPAAPRRSAGSAGA